MPENRTALVVVGGGPAALAAARAYREHGGGGDVLLVADEGRMPYARPPLTKEFLMGRMREDELPLEDDGWADDHGVRLVPARAVWLDAAARAVTLDDGRELRYEQAVLALGAVARRLPVPGTDLAGVLVVRTVTDVRGLLARVRDGDPVIVIGSGFVGCEVASSLRLRGHEVTLVSDEGLPQAARLGDAVGERLRTWLTGDGVRLRLGAGVDTIERVDAHRLRVVAGDGPPLIASAVVMAAGAQPRVELARTAGLALREGGIPADSRLRTSVPGLLAAGDAVHAHNATADRALRVEHWGEALEQGAVAGATAAGHDAKWDTVPGFWSTIGDRTLKHAAWGDGFDEVQVVDHGGGAFTAWYRSADGTPVGVLTHDHDADYDAGRAQIADAATVGADA